MPYVELDDRPEGWEVADEMTAAEDQQCPRSRDGDGRHCNCWFNPPNGGGMGADPCCYCEGEPYCAQVEDDSAGHYREWDAVGSAF